MGYQQGMHQKGIKNEIWMCDFLTRVNHYGCVVNHKGGTKVVEDADTENGDKISFKRWKGATHDWYNSSPLGREIGLYELIKPFIERIVPRVFKKKGMLFKILFQISREISFCGVADCIE